MRSLSWQVKAIRSPIWEPLSIFCVMVMEILLASLLYQALFRSVSVSWAGIFTTLGLIAAITFGLFHAIQTIQWKMAIRQALFLTWLLTAMLASQKILLFPESDYGLVDMLLGPVEFITLKGANGDSFFHILAIGLVIWRSLSISRTSISLRDIQVSFQLGLIILLIYGMALAPSHPYEASIGLYVYLFFALIGMSAARIASLGSERGGRIPRFGAGWFLSILFSAIGFVGLAIFIGWSASSRLVDWIVQGFIIIFAIISAGLVTLLVPLISILSRAIASIADILNRLAGQVGEIRLPKFMEDFMIQLGHVLERAAPLLVAGRGFILVFIVLVVIAAILLGLRFRVLRHTAEEEEDDDQIAEPGVSLSLWQKLAQRLSSNFNALRMRNPGQVLAAARIRQIYRMLILYAKKHGLERQASATPLEFLPQLALLFPEQTVEIEQITLAYLRVRYGEYPETMQEVEKIQHAWEAIRRRHSPAKTRR